MNTENIQSTKTALANVFISADHLKGWNIKNASVLLQSVLKRVFEFESQSAFFQELDRLGFHPEIQHLNLMVSAIWVTDPNLGRIKIECHYEQMKVH